MQALFKPRINRINDFFSSFSQDDEVIKVKVEKLKRDSENVFIDSDIRRRAKFDKIRNMIKDVENDIKSDTTVEITIRTNTDDNCIQTTSYEINPDTEYLSKLESYFDKVESMIESLFEIQKNKLIN
jgi:hypothetical protein